MTAGLLALLLAIIAGQTAALWHYARLAARRCARCGRTRYLAELRHVEDQHPSGVKRVSGWMCLDVGECREAVLEPEGLHVVR